MANKTGQSEISQNSVQRITIKLGSNVIIDNNGELDEAILSGIVREVSHAVLKGNRQCLMVSSGAIAMGRKVLSQPVSEFLSKNKTETLAFKQTCASVGQNRLMNMYSRMFAEHGLTVGQVLVTASDLGNRERYLNLRHLLEEMLALNVIPIINENDSVSTLEIESRGQDKVFGDNDKLSALVASKLGVDLLVLMTDVDGIFSANPLESREAKLIPEIRDIEGFEKIETSGASLVGRGGMAAKLDAVRLASMSGVSVSVCNGKHPGMLSNVLKGFKDKKFAGNSLSFGTLVYPIKKITGREHWLRFSSGIEGVVVVNAGAQKALEENNASLLPVGVVGIKGSFNAGDVVSVQNENGSEIARGLIAFSSEKALGLMGLNSREIKEKFGLESGNELVHKNKLVVFKEK